MSGIAYDRDRHGIHNLGRPVVIEDPAQYQRAARELGPLFYDEVGRVWVCSGYPEGSAVLRKGKRFRSARLPTSETLAGRRLTPVPVVHDMLLEQMLFVDPPEHTVVRKPLRGLCTPTSVDERDDDLRRLVDAALDTLPREGRVDLVTAFSGPLPTILSGYLLGLPERQADLIDWADAYDRVIGSLSTLPHIRDKDVIPVMTGALDKLGEVARERLGKPTNDLIGALVNGVITDPDALTPEQLDAQLRLVAANSIVLVGGGYQTLTHLLTTGLLLLAQHPDQQRLLRERPELADSAVDEFMRLDGSSQYLARQATEDVELGGKTIKAGQTVVVLLAAANTDPRQFPDPYTLDITRQQGRHLGFGLGNHYCLGAPYAERVARWAIRGFLDRYPRYEIAPEPDALVFSNHVNTRCHAHARVDLYADALATTEPATEPETDIHAEADIDADTDIADGTEDGITDAIEDGTADDLADDLDITDSVPQDATVIAESIRTDTVTLDAGAVVAATVTQDTVTLDAGQPAAGRLRVEIDLATYRATVLDAPAQAPAAGPPATGPQPGDPDWHLQIVEWNDTAVPVDPQTCWHHVFEQRAAMYPDAIAVDDQGVEHTYRQIDERANALAHELRRRGVQPESVVAVVMERSAEYVTAILAVSKAGGAFMLADRVCPVDRLRAMVADVSARLVLTSEAAEADVAAMELPAEVLTVGETGTAEASPVTGVTPGNTAYVVFTSGTTGRPKAVAISHLGAVNLHVAHRRVLRLGTNDRVLQFLSPNFDGCVADLTMALLSGATAVVVPGSHLVVGPSLTRLLRDRRVTCVTMTPSVWAALPVDELPDLRIAAAAGERCPSTVVRRWLAPGRRFLNLYGPAEAAVWSSWHECSGVDEHPPIGRPVANRRLYLLDEHRRPVPVGAEGELYIGGLGIGRYLGHPELMEERFCPDPFADSPAAVLYRTGDICRWRSDGVLEYAGRQDRQVKIRGQRVELDEVEEVLTDAPGVVAAAVTEEGGRLVGTVLPEPSEFDEGAVREHLQRKLHTGMMPRLRLVDDLPRTLNGKVDRRTLNGHANGHTNGHANGHGTVNGHSNGHANGHGPVNGHANGHANGHSKTRLRLAHERRAGTQPTAEPAAARTGSTAEFEKESQLVWRLAQLFAQCLGVTVFEVKDDADFLSLGGDSLSTAELLTAVEEEFEVVLEPQDIPAAPTPRQMAATIMGRRSGRAARPEVAVS